MSDSYGVKAACEENQLKLQTWEHVPDLHSTRRKASGYCICPILQSAYDAGQGDYAALEAKLEAEKIVTTEVIAGSRRQALLLKDAYAKLANNEEGWHTLDRPRKIVRLEAACAQSTKP